MDQINTCLTSYTNLFEFSFQAAAFLDVLCCLSTLFLILSSFSFSFKFFYAQWLAGLVLHALSVLKILLQLVLWLHGQQDFLIWLTGFTNIEKCQATTVNSSYCLLISLAFVLLCKSLNSLFRPQAIESSKNYHFGFQGKYYIYQPNLKEEENCQEWLDVLECSTLSHLQLNYKQSLYKINRYWRWQFSVEQVDATCRKSSEHKIKIWMFLQVRLVSAHHLTQL